MEDNKCACANCSEQQTGNNPTVQEVEKPKSIELSDYQSHFFMGEKEDTIHLSINGKSDQLFQMFANAFEQTPGLGRIATAAARAAEMRNPLNELIGMIQERIDELDASDVPTAEGNVPGTEPGAVNDDTQREDWDAAISN